MAFCTASRVATLTGPVRFTPRVMVERDTPASRATSLIVTRFGLRRFKTPVTDVQLFHHVSLSWSRPNSEKTARTDAISDM